MNAALAGKPQIEIGDALGSNIVNVALMLALVLVISEIQSPRDSVKRDLPVALLIPIIANGTVHPREHPMNSENLLFFSDLILPSIFFQEKSNFSSQKENYRRIIYPQNENDQGT